MGIFDDEDSDDVMRVDPSALSTGWSALVDGLASMESTVSETVDSGYDVAAESAGSAYEFVAEEAGAGYDVAAESAGSAYEFVAEEAGAGYDVAAETAGTAYEFVAEEAGAGYDVAAETAGTAYEFVAEEASAGYDVAAETAGTAYEFVAEEASAGYDVAAESAGSAYEFVAEEAGAGYDVAAESAGTAYEFVAEEASAGYDAAAAQATVYAEKAAADFEADPVGFVARAVGAPTVTVDADSSDGTLSLHASSWAGKVDADWQDGKGSHVTSQVGMDWGAAPYLKTDLQTNDQGEITHFDGTAKITVPLEGVSAKGEWQGSYDKTAEGYKAEYSQIGGVSIDGVELTAGLKGGVDDHGERGMIVHGGPQVSVGMGALAPAEGFDIVEGAVKGGTDVSYGNLDGHTTVGVQQTVGTEGKVFGQAISGNQNVLGVKYVDGPQGEQVVIQDTMSSGLGHDSVGKVGVSDSGTLTIGLHDDGPEVESLVVQHQTTVTGPGGAPVYDQTLTRTVEDPFTVDLPPGDGESQAPAATTFVEPQQTFEQQPAVLTNPDESWENQPLVLTNPDESWENQPLVLTNPDESFVEEMPLVLTNPDAMFADLPGIEEFPVIDEFPIVEEAVPDPIDTMWVEDDLTLEQTMDSPTPVYEDAPFDSAAPAEPEVLDEMVVDVDVVD